ncbi:hypothetical protein ACOZ4I_15725 [Haloarcula salina]|uniref:hypothetical protein n=1 Tax=Haloarcula salina TaxID=1429914 RepID=UPI003C6F32EF
MTDAYALRALAHPRVAPEATATLVGLGAASYLGGTAASGGQYDLAGLAMLVMLGLLVALKRVDDCAREVARRTR